MNSKPRIACQHLPISMGSNQGGYDLQIVAFLVPLLLTLTPTKSEEQVPRRLGDFRMKERITTEASCAGGGGRKRPSESAANLVWAVRKLTLPLSPVSMLAGPSLFTCAAYGLNLPACSMISRTLEFLIRFLNSIASSLVPILMKYDFIWDGNRAQSLAPSGTMAASHAALSFETGSYATKGICTGSKYNTALPSTIPGRITG